MWTDMWTDMYYTYVCIHIHKQIHIPSADMTHISIYYCQTVRFFFVSTNINCIVALGAKTVRLLLLIKDALQCLLLEFTAWALGTLSYAPSLHAAMK